MPYNALNIKDIYPNKALRAQGRYMFTMNKRTFYAALSLGFTVFALAHAANPVVWSSDFWEIRDGVLKDLNQSCGRSSLAKSHTISSASDVASDLRILLADVRERHERASSLIAFASAYNYNCVHLVKKGDYQNNSTTTMVYATGNDVIEGEGNFRSAHNKLKSDVQTALQTLKAAGKDRYAQVCGSALTRSVAILNKQFERIMADEKQTVESCTQAN